MSLDRGLTTTSTKKRSDKKITKSQQEELERGWRDRNQRLKEMRLPKETFDQYVEWLYGRGKKEKTRKKCNPTTSLSSTKRSIGTNENVFAGPTSSRRVENNQYKSLLSSTLGPCSSKPAPTYTGTKMIGITVIHKSCLQPIFSQEEAIDAARMRR